MDLRTRNGFDLTRLGYLRAGSPDAARPRRGSQRGPLGERTSSRVEPPGQACMSSSCLPFVSCTYLLTKKNDSSAKKA